MQIPANAITFAVLLALAWVCRILPYVPELRHNAT
jgi:hypothetical protein